MRIAITPGEPAGVGPEVLVRLIQEDIFTNAAGQGIELVVVGSRELLEKTAMNLGLPLELTAFNPKKFQAHRPQNISIIDIPLNADFSAGTLNAANGTYVLQTLEVAADLCTKDALNALVTGPVHKGIINESGYSFTGHTEFLADRANCDQVVMMLATEGLRVALATTHLPLKDVAAAITEPSLDRTLKILIQDLQTQFGIVKPKVLVCGLNPHAGEGGHMGREEIEVITPVLEKFRQQGAALEGPLPADTLFTPKYLERADAVLAMYHDQGLPVLKYKGFGQAVNITLGLPYIRTSVDHGTALDIAGKGIADTGSLRTALQYAVNMLKAKQNLTAVDTELQGV